MANAAAVKSVTRPTNKSTTNKPTSQAVIIAGLLDSRGLPSGTTNPSRPENDPPFWQTHSRAEVAEYMRSVSSDSDGDPRIHLSTLKVPGFWAFGGQDSIMPADLSVTPLSELIARGQSHFQYREYPALGHELVLLDLST